MSSLKGLRMNTALTYTLAALLPALSGGQALACYTVYNRANQVIYHAAQAPVDMRYQLHQTLPAIFPDGHMVFSITDTSCPPVNLTRSNVRDSVSSRVAYAAWPGATMMQTPGTRPYKEARN